MTSEALQWPHASPGPTPAHMAIASFGVLSCTPGILAKDQPIMKNVYPLERQSSEGQHRHDHSSRLWVSLLTFFQFASIGGSCGKSW